MGDLDELVPWLRAAVKARMKLAREASPHSDGHWWRRTTELVDGGPPEPVGHLYAGERVFDDDGEVFGGESIVVYDEGAPSDWQFDLIAENDPRDTIARCEAELAILDFHDLAVTVERAKAGPPKSAEVLRIVVRQMGHGYRHWPGYQESEWKP